MDGTLHVIDMLGNTISQLQTQLQQAAQQIEWLQAHRCDDCAEKVTGQLVVPDLTEGDPGA